MENAELDFSGDTLGRQKFADLLVKYAINISKAIALPAGRVIAVDSPWGSGKTWVASRLAAHFEGHAQIGACVYIDAYQYDHHQDPFALIASAIITKFKDQSLMVSGFKQAASGVIRSALPALGKGLLKAGSKTLGLDSEDLLKAVVDASSDASEKAIDRMLDTYSESQASTESFQKKLKELAETCSARGPIVIVIDELDRCRPDFALELLERVKHLFDVPNVVFLFFVHTPALHSAIKQTYGQDIDAHQYLRKFFALSIGLPLAEKATLDKSVRTAFLEKFINSRFSNLQGGISFREALAQFAPSFNASFRDIENVILAWQVVDGSNNFPDTEVAYGLLLRIIDPASFALLRAKVRESYAFEVSRIGPKNPNEGGHVAWMRDVLSYGANPQSVGTHIGGSGIAQNEQELRVALTDFTRVLDRLVLEHVRLN